MRVQTHPCTRERRSRVGVTWQCTVAQEGTTLMLRNDFVKNIKYKLSIPEALGSSGYRQDRYPTPTPAERRTTEQARPHFPVITGGRPFLVILPSPPICLVFPLPCTGLHPLPFLLCPAGVWGGVQTGEWGQDRDR